MDMLLLMMLLMTRMLADVVSFCRGGYLACPVPPTWAIHDEPGWEGTGEEKKHDNFWNRISSLLYHKFAYLLCHQEDAIFSPMTALIHCGS